MIIYKEEVKKTPLTKICDKCNREANMYKADELIEFNSFYRIEFYGCYGSIFADGGLIKLDLCQHCLMELIGDTWKKRVEKEKEGKS